MIREIRQFQQTPYKIERIPKVVNYILDTGRLLDEEELYQRSLLVEPRSSRLSSSFNHGSLTMNISAAVAAAAAASSSSSTNQKEEPSSEQQQQQLQVPQQQEQQQQQEAPAE